MPKSKPEVQNQGESTENGVTVSVISDGTTVEEIISIDPGEGDRDDRADADAERR